MPNSSEQRQKFAQFLLFNSIICHHHPGPFLLLNHLFRNILDSTSFPTRGLLFLSRVHFISLAVSCAAHQKYDSVIVKCTMRFMFIVAFVGRCRLFGWLLLSLANKYYIVEMPFKYIFSFDLFEAFREFRSLFLSRFYFSLHLYIILL